MSKRQAERYPPQNAMQDIMQIHVTILRMKLVLINITQDWTDHYQITQMERYPQNTIQDIMKINVRECRM